MPTPHIESKKEDIAKIVLMPGDPRRALYIAENYLDQYKKVNSVRGEDAYTGYYKGKEVTIFSSGMGIASMGIYSYELFKEYDVDIIIRIGSCGSYKEEVKLHDILLVKNSISNTNYGLEFCNYEECYVSSCDEINNVIVNTAKENKINVIEGNVHTVEAFYNNVNIDDYSNTLAVEMECYALFLNAKHLNKKATAILTVSDHLITHEKMTSEEREKDVNNMILLALESILNL